MTNFWFWSAMYFTSDIRVRLTEESLFYCHPSVIIHLKLLFGMMMLHGFVPDDFGIGVLS